MKLLAFYAAFAAGVLHGLWAPFAPVKGILPPVFFLLTIALTLLYFVLVDRIGDE